MGLLDNQTQQAYYSSGNYGDYQFVSLDNIISGFMVAYVGEGKLISKVNTTDVQFHGMRAIQELSYDILKSIRSYEIEVNNALNFILPQDYVNYVKLTRLDSDGIERTLYPTGKTSNPFKPQVDSNNEFLFDSSGDTIPSGNLIKNGNFIGGSNYWDFNTTNSNSGVITPQTTQVGSGVSNLGDPVVGWFYGFNGNAIGAYNLPAYWDLFQKNIPIITGESYKIKYTLSGYTSGTWVWYISDGQGDWGIGTERTANGTYEETIVAGSGGSSNYEPNMIFFRNTDNENNNGNVTIDSISIVKVGNEETSTTWDTYQDQTSAQSTDATDASDIDLDYRGRRYGLDPQHSQSNGTFFIDSRTGVIHFGSTLAGETVTLKYISDGIGDVDEIIVHKFAEEAVYKHIAYGVLSTRSNIPPFIIQRFKKEKFAETRKAKIRLSNIKMEEFTQVLKGMGKQIK